MIIAISTLVFLVLTSVSMSAQIAGSNSGERSDFHQFSMFSGVTWYPIGEQGHAPDNNLIFAYTFGLSYSFWFSESWAVATFDDMEFVHISIESEVDGETVEIQRENVLLLTAGVEYRILKDWTAYLGGGVETDEHETLAVVRLTTEYALFTERDWEATLSASFNHKDIYYVFSAGLAVVYTL